MAIAENAEERVRRLHRFISDFCLDDSHSKKSDAVLCAQLLLSSSMQGVKKEELAW